MSTQKQKAVAPEPQDRRVVLVVDDDESTRSLLELWLSKASLHVLEAASGEEALAIVGAAPDAIDVVLLDVMMSGMDGFEVLRHLKADPRSKHIPILFLSASADESDVVRGVQGGAVDYLNKPFSGPILVTKVKATIERGRAERALEDRLRSAEDNATHDVLTGLPNRRDFENRLTEMIANAVRHREPLALLMLDVDTFKAVNDEQGHLVGDEALKHLASKLRGATRAGDRPFRYGGDEFALLLHRGDRRGALALFERLRESLRAGPLVLQDGTRVPLSVSGGVASMEQDNAFRLVNLVGRADAALYVAKRGGRDRVAVETPGTSAEAMAAVGQRAPRRDTP